MQYSFLAKDNLLFYNFYTFLHKKEKHMKKIMLALFAVLTLAACTGTYKQGNCEYDFLLHKDISISKLIGNATGGC